jgi:uncharacterized protein (TIGR04255 family)
MPTSNQEGIFMSGKIIYNKTFLSEVVVRLDFASILSQLTDSVPPKLAETALKYFPIPEPVTSASFGTKQINQFRYFGKEREKHLALTSHYLYVSYKEYQGYKQLCDDFFNIVKVINDISYDIGLQRLGLRYINNIELSLKNPLDWKDYINDKYLSVIANFSNIASLARVLHLIDLIYDNKILRVQYGFPNPDHPAKIKRPLFIIDLDGFVTGYCDISDARKELDIIHDHVISQFESFLESKLRAIMISES